jgi:hypothetical protein
MPALPPPSKGTVAPSHAEVRRKDIPRHVYAQERDDVKDEEDDDREEEDLASNQEGERVVASGHAKSACSTKGISDLQVCSNGSARFRNARSQRTGHVGVLAERRQIKRVAGKEADPVVPY